jgi:hypothetical protein
MDDLTLKELEKTKEASDRGRWVLLAMQVSCIVVFMAAWHEVPESWTYARLRMARIAVWYLDCGAQGHPELSSEKQFTAELEKSKHDNCHFTEEDNSSLLKLAYDDSSCKRTQLNPLCADDDEIKRARTFLARRALSPAQARKYLENLEASFVERTMNVTVPFLGITLDTNDLGLLGGITFFLLLAWLLYSLRREEENVAMLFARARDEDLVPSYQLLSMTQVFTIPLKIRAKRNLLAEFLWTYLGKVLFILPLAVQCFVVWYDRRTLPIGMTLNPKGAISEFRWEIGLLAAVFLLTVLCLRGSAAVGRQWEDAYNRIQSHLKREKFC